MQWFREAEIPIRWERVAYNDKEHPEGRYRVWGTTLGYRCGGCGA